MAGHWAPTDFRTLKHSAGFFAARGPQIGTRRYLTNGDRPLAHLLQCDLLSS
jgi:hypothetical protein